MSDPPPSPITGASARPSASRTARVGGSLSRGARAAGHGTAHAGIATVRAAQRASRSGGAGATGLNRLMEVHALHNGGDAVVAIALAGSLFFTLPVGEARGQVALFLLLTLLPFSVIAPFVGPLLDRFRHGRRWAIGATTALRAALCLTLAATIGQESWWQFPAALAILILSKAYNVTRSSATPRLLPDGMSLTSANGRMSMAGVVGATVAVPVAAGAAQLGAEWALRFGFVVFAVGTVLAVRLPARVDSTRGEQEVPITQYAGGRSPLSVPLVVVTALRANAALRMLSGFLTIFMAFLLRSDPPPGWDYGFTVLIGVVVAAAGVGATLGTILGARIRKVDPMTLVQVTLLVNVLFAVLAAVRFGMVTLVLLSLVAGTCQQLGKFALDATIQQHVSEQRRTSVFGRSETLIQVSWVIGGGLGVVLPTDATIGMGVVAGLLCVSLAWVVAGAHKQHDGRLSGRGRARRT
ncbi:MAG: MFS transporter [Ornithinimicrobium sp.]|uniref:MFS transporter n=1 Tax=Ornithinimicrobium sp. TaxID=1977084 RepID=UPI003D9AE428